MTEKDRRALELEEGNARLQRRIEELMAALSGARGNAIRLSEDEDYATVGEPSS
jgi:hypothetical protein